MKPHAPDSMIRLYELRLSADSFANVRDTLRSTWLTSGPRVKEFESAVARICRVRHAAAVNSCTNGLVLALQALGLQGGEVITTPFSFVATAEAIMHAGAQPVFADIDPHSLNIDPEEVARKVTPHTRAIIAVDIAGLPAEYDRLRKVADHFTLPVIADAAHSFGALYRRKSVAQVTDAAVFSFHATKNLTCGEGGMVVSRHKILADRVRLLAMHGLTKDAHRRREEAGWRYDVIAPGRKANMSDVHAAIGLGQLPEFERRQQKREALVQRYCDNLSALSEYIDLPSPPKYVRHAWHLFIIRLNIDSLTISRDRFIDAMKARRVECGVHYIPMFELSLFRSAGFNEHIFPNAAWVGRRVVTLPLYPLLTFRQIDYICDAIADIVVKHRR
ncbi:MAG: DegT/DnrJ/EryC1/StrS family aminotransferase [candidate division Zixibacteria bacterium]|jgi:dTDP-4-amino-4,6-dideoxygalactose transaminase|nr:DegT/DnrJ/EryC1/StrS family aminotransferase [candidate division Zixibacteria bacterium]